MSISGVVSTSVSYLNANKELFKNLFSVPTALCGVFGVINLYSDVSSICSDLTNRMWKNDYKDFTTWNQTALKVVFVMTNVSIVLSSFTSRPGQMVIGWAATRIVGEECLVSWFGPNINFVTNPYHPKHVVSIAAFILGAPELVRSLYDASYWVIRKVCCYPPVGASKYADMKIQLINFFNQLTSRPLLHIVNHALSRNHPFSPYC